MSHTTEIGSVVFSDMSALDAAVKELQRKGVSCELVRDTQPRAYYSNQEGMGKAPYVLRLNHARYDVGFYPSPDGSGYRARTDLFGGSVAGQLGAPARKGETAEQAALGKLNQMYAIHAATREAARKGYQVRRVEKADGSVQLYMTGMAGS